MNCSNKRISFPKAMTASRHVLTCALLAFVAGWVNLLVGRIPVSEALEVGPHVPKQGDQKCPAAKDLGPCT